jgi:hypothetical protein
VFQLFGHTNAKVMDGGRINAKVDPEIVERIFRQNTSMGKGIGLMSMVDAVRALARSAAQT